MAKANGETRLEVGETCEALVHGKWYRSRVTRCGIQGEYDIELEDDGTELEGVEAGRLRGQPRRPARWTDWECLEAMAIDSYERRNQVGRRPSLKFAASERDELRRLELLLPSDDVQRLRSAFESADSMRDSELDVEDTLVALAHLGRSASRADVQGYLKFRGKRRTLGFLDFCKCLARLFHEPSNSTVGAVKAVRCAIENKEDVAEWARALGKARLLEMETAYRKRCEPCPYTNDESATRGEARIGLPARLIRDVFRDLGHDITPPRFSVVLHEAGFGHDDCITFVQFINLFHTLFAAHARRDGGGLLGSGSQLQQTSNLVEDSSLRPMAEIAAVVFAEGRWVGTATDHSSLVRRLCVGRPPNVQELICRARDEFEKRDVNRTGVLSPEQARSVVAALKLDVGDGPMRNVVHRLFHNTGREKNRKEAKSSSKETDSNDEEMERESRAVSMPEFFAIAGPLIEAASESTLTVASAFARLRIKCTPSEVRAAGELAAQYLRNVLAHPRENRRWRVAVTNRIYDARIGRLDGGLQLMKAIGFTQRVVEAGRRECLALQGSMSSDSKALDRLPNRVLALLKARLRDVEGEIRSYLGAPAVRTAIREMRAKGAPLCAVRDAVELAHKFVTNVLKHPTDPRFYRIRVTNPIMSSRITGLDGGLELVKAVGWVPDEQGEFVELRLRGALSQKRQPRALRSSNADFSYPRLDAETEAFLYRVVADLEEAKAQIDGELAQDGTTSKYISRKTKPIPRKPMQGHRDSARSSSVVENGSSEGILQRTLARGTPIQKAQLRMARRAFAAYDKDGDGIVSREDVRAIFRESGRRSTDAALEKWIGQHDLDKDGFVSFSDFLASLAPMFQVTQQQVSREPSKGVIASVASTDIAAAVGTLRLGAALVQVRDVVATALSHIQKVIDAPVNSQLWRIRVEEPEFKNRVAKFAGGISLMLACGFFLEENGTVLALRGENGERWDRVPSSVLTRLQRASDELRGRLLSLDYPEVADVCSVTSAISRLGAARRSEMLPVVALCSKYLRNALNNPKNDRFRIVSCQNPIFRDRVLKTRNGLELFVATGWRECSGGGAFKLPRDIGGNQLQARLLELETCMGYLKRHAATVTKPDDTTTPPQSQRRRQKQHNETVSPENISCAPKASQRTRTPAADDKESPDLRITRSLLARAQIAKDRAEEEARDARKLADSLAAELHEVKATKRQCSTRAPQTVSASNFAANGRMTRKAAPMRFGRSQGVLGNPHRVQEGAAATTIGHEVMRDVKASLVENALRGTNVIKITREPKLPASSFRDDVNENIEWNRGTETVSKASRQKWRVGYKVRISSAAGMEEPLIREIGEDSLHLMRPLTFNHAAGSVAVMVRPSADERRLFKSAQLILFIHNEILVPAIDSAVLQGEAIIEARVAQSEFESRPIPLSVYYAHPVFVRHAAKLFGAVPRLGTLVLRESTHGGNHEDMVSFDEGFTLSDLRRLFDRINASGSGRITQHELRVAFADDPDTTVLFTPLHRAGNLSLLDDVGFLNNFVPRFVTLEHQTIVSHEQIIAEYLNRSKMSPGGWISEEDLAEIALVFRQCGGFRDSILPVASLAAAFGQLEGIELKSPEDYPAALAQAHRSQKPLTLEEFIELRQTLVRQLGVPVGPDGTYCGAGINGWRRHALKAIRPVWNLTVAEASKATGEALDAAPGYEFYHRICSSDSIGAYLMLHTQNNLSLRDQLHRTVISTDAEAEAEVYLTWGMVEALVFSDVTTFARTTLAAKSRPNEVFRTGPRVLVENLGNCSAGCKAVTRPRRFLSNDEPQADAPGLFDHCTSDRVSLSSMSRQRSVHETVVNTIQSTILVLCDDGMLEIWDVVCRNLCDPSPLRLIRPTTRPRDIQRLKDDDLLDPHVHLVVQMLALKPRCQSLLLCEGVRQLLVNTTAGDGCVQFHDLNTFTEVARVRLNLPGMRDFRDYVFDLAFTDERENQLDYTPTRNDRRTRGSYGAVGSFAFVSDEELLLVAIVGDSVLRAHSSRTGDVLALMPGHTSAVGPIIYVAEQLRILASGSVDCCLRIWDVGRDILSAARKGTSGSIQAPLAISPAFLIIQQVFCTAIAAVGLPPGWREGMITAVIDTTLLGTEKNSAPVVEVEYDDDHSIEFVNPKQLHKRSAPHAPLDNGRLVRCVETRSGMTPSVQVSAGVPVAVWHDRQRRSIRRLFSKFPSSGPNRVAHDDFVDVAWELCNTYASEASRGQLTQCDLWRLVHALDSQGRSFISYEAFELFAMQAIAHSGDTQLDGRDRLVYVPARRILRGHSAAVCALVFLPHTSLIASSAADGTVRLWDPRQIQHNLSLPSPVCHLRHSPGYYLAANDEWVSPPPMCFVLKLVDAAAVPPTYRKLSATTLRAVTLRNRATRSQVRATPSAVQAARTLDENLSYNIPVGNVVVRGMLYLLDDGTVRHIATEAFDERLVTLAVEDAGFFHAGTDAATLTWIFSERKRIIRVAYVASKAYNGFSMLLDALDAHRDERNLHPLSSPGGGDANMLRVLQIELVLFTRETDSTDNDIRHLIACDDIPHQSGETPLDIEEADGAGSCCELLLGELTVRSAPQRVSSTVVVAWAICRASYLTRADMSQQMYDQQGTSSESRAIAIRTALGSWRFALHAHRSTVTSERQGASGIAQVARDVSRACCTDGAYLLLQPGDLAKRDAVRRSFELAARLPSTSMELRLTSESCLRLAFRRAKSKTGNPVLPSDLLMDEIRAAADILRCDVQQMNVEALSTVPALTLTRARHIVAAHHTLVTALSTIFLLQRPLSGKLTFALWQRVIDNAGGAQLRALQEAGYIAASKVDYVSFLLASDLTDRVEACCATITGHTRQASRTLQSNKEIHLSWMQRWACLVESESWAVQIRIAREEAWAATNPLAARVDALLLATTLPQSSSSVSAPLVSVVFTMPSRAYCLVGVDKRIEGLSSLVADAYRCIVSLRAADEVVEPLVSYATRPALCFRLRGTFGDGALSRTRDVVTATELLHQNLLAGLVILSHPQEAGDCDLGQQALTFDFEEDATMSLRDVLNMHGGLGLDNRGMSIVRLWLRQLCAGLAHMHSLGLVCRTLRSEHVLVSADGRGLRIVPLLPCEVNEAGFAHHGPLLDGAGDLFPADSILTPPESIEVAMAISNWGCLEFRFVDRRASERPVFRKDRTFTVSEEAPSWAWDSWSLGVVLSELIFAATPVAWSAQLSRYFERARDYQREAICHNKSEVSALRAAASSLHFDALDLGWTSSHDDRRSYFDTASTCLAALSCASVSPILDVRKSLEHHKELPRTVARNALQASVAILAADTQLRSAGHLNLDIERDFVYSRVRASLSRRGADVSNVVRLSSVELARAVLIDDCCLSLNDSIIKTLIDEFDTWEDLEPFLTLNHDGVAESHEALACLIACFEPRPSRRILATSLFDSDFLCLGAEASAAARLDAGAYVAGVAPKRRWWYATAIVQPLARLEQLAEINGSAAVRDEYVRLVREMTRLVRGEYDENDFDRLMDDGVLARCLKFATCLTIEPNLAASVCSLVLESLRRVRYDRRHLDRIVNLSARFLTSEASIRSKLEEETVAIFDEVAPHEYLRSVVGASRALRDATDARVGRRGAARAFAALCRLDDPEVAQVLLDTDAATRLLLLTSDRACSDVRVSALQCAHHACVAGFPLGRKVNDSRRVLAFEFTNVAWLAALARVIRSPSATRKESDAAYDALGAMVAAGDDATRALTTGGALTALIFAMQQTKATHPSRPVQDTSEAGGQRHRLLQPFQAAASAADFSRAAQARRVLSDILLGSSRIASLLNTAYPHVVAALM